MSVSYNKYVYYKPRYFYLMILNKIKMIKITDENFIPYQSIPKSKNPKNEPDVVFYPDIFAGKISDIMIKKLSKLHYKITRYCFMGKIVEAPRKMLWFADNPNWTYVFSKNHMYGLPAQVFPPFLRCIQMGVERVTNQKFNACLVNIYEGGNNKIGWHDDNDAWLGTDFIVPSISFGQVRRFILRSKANHRKKIEIATLNGSMIIMRESVQKYWQHSIPKQSKITGAKRHGSGAPGVRFNLTFRNVHPNLVHKMPKFRTICGSRPVVKTWPFGPVVLRTWYAQLSDVWLPEFKRATKMGVGVINYPQGRAKMKVFPEKDDNVLVVSKKYIIYSGKILRRNLGSYTMKIHACDPPVFIGKYFRRNWQQCRDEEILEKIGSLKLCGYMSSQS